jgi:hypothetical protein
VTDAALEADPQVAVEVAREIVVRIEQPRPVAGILERLRQLAEIPQRGLRERQVQVIDPRQAPRQAAMIVEQPEAQADLEFRVQPAVAADDEYTGS